MTSNRPKRAFSVHARQMDHPHAHLVTEPSFEAAAVAYLEDFHPLGEASEISVVVRELESGREHCFRVDLLTGETTPCG